MRTKRPRCFDCGRGLSAKHRPPWDRLAPELRLMLAIFLPDRRLCVACFWKRERAISGRHNQWSESERTMDALLP